MSGLCKKRAKKGFKNCDENHSKPRIDMIRGPMRGGSRPISRVLSWTAIPLGCTSPCTSSSLPGNTRGPRAAGWRTIRPVPLFGLAPGGVCRAVPVTRPAVRSYRTVSPLPALGKPSASAVCFLLHFPWARAPQALPGAIPCGARTFLPRTSRERLPGRLPEPR